MREQPAVAVCRVFRDSPVRPSAEIGEVAEQALRDCCTLFGGTAAVAMWEESEEPWLTIASGAGASFVMREADAGAYTPLVACDSTCYAGAETLHPAVREELGGGGALAILLRGDLIDGRLFVVDPADVSDDVVAAADIAGLLAGVRLDCALHMRAALRDAVKEERIRVGRDLHDGLLQSFTGVVLQLETIHSILDSRPEDARRMITEAEAMLMADQRELRRYVDQLRPRTRKEPAFDFTARLEELRNRFASQWGILVHYAVDGLEPIVFGAMGQETFRIIAEAVTNAAKHGAATQIDVAVRSGEGAMHIDVADNGSGFSFHGTRDLDALRAAGGPAALTERVAALNGDLSIHSTDRGARIAISIPLGWRRE